MKKNSVCCLLFFLAVILCSCGPKDPGKLDPKKPKAVTFIEGVVVGLSNLDETVTVPGTLKPFDETVLCPEVSGRVVLCDIPEGKFVKKGTLLAKLADADLQAQLGKAEAQLKIAEATEKRSAELLKVSGVSQAEYDVSALSVNSVRADIEVLKAQIRKTEVLAPFDGTVGLRNISVGAAVTPSTALLTLRATHRFKLDFSVPEKYGRFIRPGLSVKFTLQNDEPPYAATVMATEQGIEASTRTLKVRALCHANATELIPGTFVTVTLVLGDKRTVFMIPTQAVIPKADKKTVFVSRQGKAVMVPITTGVRRSSSIEVLSGLSAGDTVVTTGLLFIKPGMALSFARVAK